MWGDCRMAVRRLLRQPSFTIVVTLTLALGMGGAITIFSVVNAVLLRDLPYPDATGSSRFGRSHPTEPPAP